MIVYKLQEQDAEKITGVLYNETTYFNPIQDFYGNWVISAEEFNNITNPEFLYLKQTSNGSYTNVTPIEFVPVPINITIP